MERTHRLLGSQISKCFGGKTPELKEWESFIKSIDETYSEFDNDRNKLEESLELAAKERFAYKVQMQKVRKIAAGIDSKANINDILAFVVESSKDIEEIGFVLVETMEESGENIVTPYFSRITSDDDKKTLKNLGIDLERLLGVNPARSMLKLPLAKITVANDYIANPRVIVKTRLSELLEGVCPTALCDAIQHAFGYEQFVIVPLMVNGISWGILLFFLKGSIASGILETIGAHCSLGIKNVLAAKDLETTITYLSESERIYRLIANSTADYICVTTINGVYTYASPSHKRLGYDEKDLIGKNAFDFMHPDDKKKLLPLLGEYAKLQLEGLVKLQKEEHSRIVAFRTRDKNGEWHSMEAHASLIDLGDGNSISIVIVSRDVTENIRNNDLLKESEERYRSIFESANDIIFVIDKKGKILDVNQKIKEIAGYDKSELIGHNIFSLTNILPLKSLTAIMLNFGKRMMGIHVGPYELEMNKKDGQIALIEINARALISEGRIIGDLAILRDCTERKRAEDETTALLQTLDRKANEWQDTFDAVSDLVTLISPEHIILRVNRRGAEMLGAKPEALIGMKCYKVLHGLDHPIDGCPCLTAAKTGKDESNEIFHSGRCYLANAAPILGETGKITAFAHTIKDITEAKRLGDERLRTSKLESLGLLAGGIAHDFNNVLAGILANVQISKTYVQRGDQNSAFETLSDAEDAAYRARSLTQQLLTFSRGGAPVKKAISVESVVRQNVGFILSGSKSRPDFDFAENVWWVEADEGQIGQVIDNLVLNADHAMPDGGIINICVSNIAEGKSKALGLVEGQYVKIAITDHGTGIPKKYFDKLFDPYFTTKEKGSGLGLTTAFSIIKQHNGLLTFDSELGVGSTFYVYLPAATGKFMKDSESKNNVSMVATKAGSAFRGKILVMDDDNILRTVLGRVLKEVGYEVTLTSEGNEAVREYSNAKEGNSPFVAIILDLTIPGGMGGKETMERIKKIDPNVKAVVASGFANDNALSEYRKYGFSGVVSKPYKIEEMEEVLTSVINGRQGDCVNQPMPTCS